jgi:hypothetical protein
MVIFDEDSIYPDFIKLAFINGSEVMLECSLKVSDFSCIDEMVQFTNGVQGFDFNGYEEFIFFHQ